jgi:hypothetical protein
VAQELFIFLPFASLVIKRPNLESSSLARQTVRLKPHCNTNDAGLAVCFVLLYAVNGAWKGSALSMRAGCTPKNGKHNRFKEGLKAKLFGQPEEIMFTCSGLVPH